MTVMTKNITSQDWKDIEEKLKSFYNIVKLRCDGYEISLKLERISVFKNAIYVYIDGVVKGEWVLNDCEERRRFYRPVTRTTLSKKQMDAFKKIYRTKKEREDLERRSKFTAYYHYWTSFGSLKKHFIDNNQHIELVCKDEEEVAT